MSWDLLLRGLEFVCWIGAGLYTFLSNKDRVTHDQLQAFDEKQDAQALALATLEERMNHMPTELTLSNLTQRLGELRGAVEGFREECSRISRQYERIDDWLKRQL